jgi:hypothetical protein
LDSKARHLFQVRFHGFPCSDQFSTCLVYFHQVYYITTLEILGATSLYIRIITIYFAFV